MSYNNPSHVVRWGLVMKTGKRGKKKKKETSQDSFFQLMESNVSVLQGISADNMLEKLWKRYQVSKDEHTLDQIDAFIAKLAESKKKSKKTFINPKITDRLMPFIDLLAQHGRIKWHLLPTKEHYLNCKSSAEQSYMAHFIYNIASLCEKHQTSLPEEQLEYMRYSIPALVDYFVIKLNTQDEKISFLRQAHSLETALGQIFQYQVKCEDDPLSGQDALRLLDHAAQFKLGFKLDEILPPMKEVGGCEKKDLEIVSFADEIETFKVIWATARKLKQLQNDPQLNPYISKFRGKFSVEITTAFAITSGHLGVEGTPVGGMTQIILDCVDFIPLGAVLNKGIDYLDTYRKTKDYTCFHQYIGTLEDGENIAKELVIKLVEMYQDLSKRHSVPIDLSEQQAEEDVQCVFNEIVKNMSTENLHTRITVEELVQRVRQHDQQQKNIGKVDTKNENHLPPGTLRSLSLPSFSKLTFGLQKKEDSEDSSDDEFVEDGSEKGACICS